MEKAGLQKGQLDVSALRKERVCFTRTSHSVVFSVSRPSTFCSEWRNTVRAVPRRDSRKDGRMTPTIKRLLLFLLLLIPAFAYGQGGTATLIRVSAEPLPFCTPATQPYQSQP